VGLAHEKSSAERADRNDGFMQWVTFLSPHERDSEVMKVASSVQPARTTSNRFPLTAADAAAPAPFHKRSGRLLGGGIVIKVADEVVGAIGAPGAPGGDLDDACARAGLDKIKDQLK
jgi:uncharacterized protein GlcG (DUF336 family)